MFSVVLHNGGATRRYSISAEGAAGWTVTLQREDERARDVRYHDWHRVERALALIRLEISELEAQGWRQTS